jgi:hypothetical protein
MAVAQLYMCTFVTFVMTAACVVLYSNGISADNECASPGG